jgi:DNA topoisomerase-2
VVAGVHGLGVKLVSIFSSEFQVSVRDARTGSTYDQTWREQMTKRTDPKVRIHDKPIAGFVDVRFSPVPALGALTDDVRGLMAKRALDVALAARPGVRVEVRASPCFALPY